MKADLKSLLSTILSQDDLASIYKSFDVIGDVAVIRVPESSLQYSEVIAKALMLQNKHVKSVWRQSGPVFGDFRLRELEWVSGDRRTETIHKEYGCLFKVDLRNCYFSPRLAFERMRIANLVNDGDVVVNMFAGVGAYSIVIAKHSKVARVYSIDVNPSAVRYMRENILLNKVVGKVFPMEGDARVFTSKALKDVAERVLMPLPKRAIDFLDCAVSAVKPERGWIHFYDFIHANKGESPIEKSKSKVEEKLQGYGIFFEVSHCRIVRETGPNWYQTALDIKVGK